MIVDVLLQFFSAALSHFFDIVTFLGVPYEQIATLQTASNVVVWFVGADLLTIIFTNILAWYTLRLGLGIVLFVINMIH